MVFGKAVVPIYQDNWGLVPAWNSPIIKIVASHHHSFFQHANHAWHSCGSNSKEQLGLKTRSEQLTLIEIDFSQFEPTPHLSKEDKRGPLKYDARRKDFYYGQSLDQLFARKNKGSQAPAEPPEPDDEIINSDGEEEGRIYRVGK